MKAWIVGTALVLAAALGAGVTPPARAALPATATAAAKPPPPDPTTPVGGEFGSDETFCAKTTASGWIRYDVIGRQVTLDLHVAGLPKRTDLGVGWHNAHTPRGYLIASFETNRQGKARRASLRMFRPGETRGSAIFLVTRADHVAARLRPCRRH